MAIWHTEQAIYIPQVRSLLRLKTFGRVRVITYLGSLASILLYFLLVEILLSFTTYY